MNDYISNDQSVVLGRGLKLLRNSPVVKEFKELKEMFSAMDRHQKDLELARLTCNNHRLQLIQKSTVFYGLLSKMLIELIRENSSVEITDGLGKVHEWYRQNVHFCDVDQPRFGSRRKKQQQNASDIAGILKKESLDIQLELQKLREDMKSTSASVQDVKDISGPSGMELKMKLDTPTKQTSVSELDSFPLCHQVNPHVPDLTADCDDKVFPRKSSNQNRVECLNKWKEIQKQSAAGQDILSHLQLVGRSGTVAGIRYTAHDSGLAAEQYTNDVVVSLVSNNTENLHENISNRLIVVNEPLERFYELTADYEKAVNQARSSSSYRPAGLRSTIQSAPCRSKYCSVANQQRAATTGSPNVQLENVKNEFCGLDSVVGLIDLVTDEMITYKEKLVPDPQRGYRQPTMTVDRISSLADRVEDYDAFTDRSKVGSNFDWTVCGRPYSQPASGVDGGWELDSVIEAQIDRRLNVSPEPTFPGPNCSSPYQKDSSARCQTSSYERIRSRMSEKKFRSVSSMDVKKSLRSAGSTHAGGKPMSARPATTTHKFGAPLRTTGTLEMFEAETKKLIDTTVKPHPEADVKPRSSLASSTKKRNVRKRNELEYLSFVKPISTTSTKALPKEPIPECENAGETFNELESCFCGSDSESFTGSFETFDEYLFLGEKEGEKVEHNVIEDERREPVEREKDAAEYWKISDGLLVDQMPGIVQNKLAQPSDVGPSIKKLSKFIGKPVAPKYVTKGPAFKRATSDMGMPKDVDDLLIEGHIGGRASKGRNKATPQTQFVPKMARPQPPSRSKSFQSTTGLKTSSAGPDFYSEFSRTVRLQKRLKPMTSSGQLSTLSKDTNKVRRPPSGLKRSKSANYRKRQSDCDLSMNDLSRVGLHVDLYTSFHSRKIYFDKNIPHLAATLIQKIVRGWLVRQNFARLKRKMNQNVKSLASFWLQFKRTISRVQSRNGVDKPSVEFNFKNINEFMDLQRKYEVAFERRVSGTEMDVTELKNYFSDLGFYPSQNEMQKAINATLMDRQKSIGEQNLTKNDVIEITFTIYPPRAAGIPAAVRRSTWMNPIDSGKETNKLIDSRTIEPTPFKDCWDLVTKSHRERKFKEDKNRHSKDNKENQ